MEFDYDPNNYRQDWIAQSCNKPPLILLKEFEMAIRSSSPGPGGFPEGHLFVSTREKKGNVPERIIIGMRPADYDGAKSIRIATTISKHSRVPTSFIPYIALHSPPPQECIAAFLHYSKFLSIGVPIWVDQLLVFNPSGFSLFNQFGAKGETRTFRDISETAHLLDKIDTDQTAFFLRLRDEFNHTITITLEQLLRDNQIDQYIKEEIRRDGQPPLFSYYFSPFLKVK